MTDLQARCLDEFPKWLRSLADDARAPRAPTPGPLAAVLGDKNLSEPPRRQLIGALNYLFKSLDLIPDGIEDLGFIDDAFVFRVAADAALQGGDTPAADSSGTLARLSGEAALIREFLGAD